MNDLPRIIDGIPVGYRDQPWSNNLRFIIAQERMTIAEIAEKLPPEIAARPFALINEEPIPREMWHLVRVKKPTSKMPIIVTFPPILQGGGKTGNIIKAVAAIAVLVAVTVIAPYISAALAPTLLATFGISAATTLALTQAVLTVGGALLVSALTPSPSISADAASDGPAPETFKNEASASLSGNVLSRGGSVPRVVGRLKVFPPFIVPPLQELVGDDIFIEAVYGMAGPHKWEDPRSDSADLDDIPNVDYETREGFAVDAALTIVTRQSKTNPTVIQLSKFQVDPANQQNLLDQTTPTNSAPVWHPTRFTGAPDEAWLCLTWPSGMFDPGILGSNSYVPMRLRFREVGSSTWINCPEMWFSYNKQEGFNKDIRFKWGTTPAFVSPSTQKCPVYAIPGTPMRVENTFNFGMTLPADLRNGFDGISNLNDPFMPSGSNVRAGFGSNWNGFPRAISHARIRASLGWWTNGGSGTVTINLRASHTSPGSNTSGTVIGTVSSTNRTANPLYIISADQTTLWEYVWLDIAITTSSATPNVPVEVDFYGPASNYSWQANSYFLSGLPTVSDRMSNGNGAGSVLNTRMYADRVEFWLDPGTFPQGNYDIEIMQGCVVRGSGGSTSFDIISYSNTTDFATGNTNSLVYDCFRWGGFMGGTKTTPQSLDTLQWGAQRSRASHIWNSAPVIGTDFAMLALKAKNQQLGQLSAIVSGYTKDWDGSGWNTVTITSNPAPHMYEALTGTLNADPLPLTLVDNEDFVEWRQQCIDKGYECNAVVDNRTVMDVANILCGCGYARLRPAEKWGVFMDRDRSAEGPTNVYTHKNMSGFHWDKAFPRLPDGFRARFTDIDNDYIENEIIILRPGITDTGRYEDIRYEGLITSAEVEARALFDLAQLVQRPVFYTGTTNFQYISNRRGDLVALQVDVLDRFGGSSYITGFTTSGGNITGLTLYGSVPIETGSSWGVAIRGLDGSLLIKQIVDPGTDDDYKTVTFTTPFADPGTSVIDVGALVVSGALGIEYRRVIVHSIMPKTDTAEIVFVDEAPQLWGALTARAIIRQYGLDDSLVLCLDAGDSESYTSGQVWIDTSDQGNNFWFGVNGL